MVFYGASEKMTARETQHARSICFTCPVQRRCLLSALLNGEPHGIWGGFTAAERRAALRRHDGDILWAMEDYDRGVFVQRRRRSA